MARKKLYRCFVDGDDHGEGTAEDWARQLHVNVEYVRKAARDGIMVAKRYTFEETGFMDGNVIAHYRNETRQRKMSMKDVCAAARSAGMSYGQYVALKGIR